MLWYGAERMYPSPSLCRPVRFVLYTVLRAPNRLARGLEPELVCTCKHTHTNATKHTHTNSFRSPGWGWCVSGARLRIQTPCLLFLSSLSQSHTTTSPPSSMRSNRGGCHQDGPRPPNLCQKIAIKFIFLFVIGSICGAVSALRKCLDAAPQMYAFSNGRCLFADILWLRWIEHLANESS